MKLRRRSASGFSMIEVMVALIVIAIAVFGTAKIQALTINATHNSASRSIAALQAASLAAAMRANPAYWGSASAPPPNLVTTYTYSASTGTGSTATDASLTALTTDCSTTVCSPQAMAAYDLRSWLASLNGVSAALPAGGADVQCATPTSTVPETCIVRVWWVEKAVGTTNVLNSATSVLNNSLFTGTNAQSYTLVVQP